MTQTRTCDKCPAHREYLDLHVCRIGCDGMGHTYTREGVPHLGQCSFKGDSVEEELRKREKTNRKVRFGVISLATLESLIEQRLLESVNWMNTRKAPIKYDRIKSIVLRGKVPLQSEPFNQRKNGSTVGVMWHAGRVRYFLKYPMDFAPLILDCSRSRVYIEDGMHRFYAARIAGLKHIAAVTGDCTTCTRKLWKHLMAGVDEIYNWYDICQEKEGLP